MADLDEPKAAFNWVMVTVNGHELDGVMACTHAGVSLFGPFSPCSL
jgi:hypothetical protein